MSLFPRARARLASISLIAALAITLLPSGVARPVAAVSPDLVISQVYGAGGNAGATYNADYVELYNRGATAASLNGLSIQYASSAGTGFLGANSGQLAELPNVSVPAGGYFLVQMSGVGTSGSALPGPDFTDPSPVAMAAGAGKVALVTGITGLGCNGGTTPCTADQLARIKDLVGYGTGTTFFEGSGPTTTISSILAAFRAGSGATDTDDNAADFTVTTPAPRTAGDSAPTITSTIPADGATGVALDTTLSVTFSEAVTLDAGTIQLACNDETVATTVGGGPTTFTVDPDANLPTSASCLLSVAGGGVHDNDAVDPPDGLAGDAVFDFTTAGPGDPCLDPFTPIFSIQGSGNAAAITGPVTTEGVVTSIVDYANGTGSFFIQDPDGDGNAATSDGIFVFVNTAGLVSVGDAVRVTGFARERFNQTSLTGPIGNTDPVATAGILDCGIGTVGATAINLPFSSSTFPERFEGMRVTFPQTLVIAEYFNYDRFGEIVLALPLDGEDRPFSGTAIDEPGARANARTAANNLRRITLDDNNPNQNPTVLRHPNGQPFALDNRFRGGDHVTSATGVLGFDFSLYRIFPTAPATYASVDPRPTAPGEVGDGTLRAAAMNTLNFFLTGDAIQDDPPAPNNPVDDVCGGNANLECRGFDTNQGTEFDRQRDKLLQALAGLDADVIGLNELENTPGVEPLLDPDRGVVAGLNALDGVGPYDAIDTGPIGTDAIRVGLIYRSDRLVPVGDFAILDSSVDPRFIDTKSRPVLAQTFEDLDTGARFTVAVNHLKSKGSDCNDVGDPDAGDGQGNCSGTRTQAAEALVDWLADDPTGSGETDVLILGDLNSYAKEDPIDAILAGADDEADTDDDFTNLIAAYQGTYAHSYVFDGQAGYLDHALASASLVGQVTGATDWHINSDEPDVVDYDTSFKPAAQEALYEPNAYRASDHDPVIVGLDADSDRPTVDAGGPYEVEEGASVGLTATGSDPTDDELTYAWDLDDDGWFETPGQAVTFQAGALQAPQTVTVTVQITDEHGQTSTDTADIRIIWDFGGFQSPSTPGEVTEIKAGSAQPLKFSLDGPQGLAVLDGNPTVQRHACPTGAAIGPVIVTASSEPFAYDASTDTYRYAWKTQKAWAGWCGTLTLLLADGEAHDLEVRFKP